jgi:hypothetical protein
MKHSAFAIIVAIDVIGYGLSLLIFPAKFLEPYRFILNSYGVLMARGYGAVLCQIAIIFWFSRNIPVSEKSWRIILGATLFYQVVMTIVDLIPIINGFVTGFGLTTVFVQLFIAAACIYFLTRGKKVKKRTKQNNSAKIFLQSFVQLTAIGKSQKN